VQSFRTIERCCRVVAIAFGSCFSRVPVPSVLQRVGSHRVMSSSRSRAYVNVVDRSRISATLQRRERQRAGAASLHSCTYLANCASHLCLCFSAHFAGGLYRSARWGSVAPCLRLCTNRKCNRDCDDACSPHFSFPVFLRFRIRSTVNQCADGERRELLRCTGRTFDFVPHEQESNSLA
jgi:hypothetical protein